MMMCSKQLMRSMSTYRKVLTAANLNPQVVEAEYAVRGELVLRSHRFTELLNRGEGSHLPFKQVIACNIGNPQYLGQRPITFVRQVLSLMNYYPPQLEKQPSFYPKDVQQRAKHYLANIPGGGIGCYSHSKGAEVLRQEVAKFIDARDGLSEKVDVENLFLTDGASQAVHMIMKSLISDEQSALLVPSPQYPLYSAGIKLYGGQMLSYDLQEQNQWGADLSQLKNLVAQTPHVKALVVINPGNPTGQVLTPEMMVQLLEFCYEHSLVLLADEVYQENIYRPDQQFHSFKKMLKTHPNKKMADELELISFHSTSKGFLGECGKRGGYMELCNISDCAMEQLYKLASVNLCSNLDGQVTTALMCNPPKQGEESYELYEQEKNLIINQMKKKALDLVNFFNSLENVSCNVTEGAMYVFPRLHLPQKAIEEAKKKSMQPDALYCMKLLESTGVVVVPGSGFGQEKGTYHLRTTILPPEHMMSEMMNHMKRFHDEFMDTYRD